MAVCNFGVVWDSPMKFTFQDFIGTFGFGVSNKERKVMFAPTEKCYNF